MKGIAVIDNSACLEAVGGRFECFEARIFGLAYSDQPLKVGGCGCAGDETRSLLDLQIKDVARLSQQAERVKSAAQLDEDAPHLTKNAGQLETQILAVTHAHPGILQYPA